MLKKEALALRRPVRLGRPGRDLLGQRVRDRLGDQRLAAADWPDAGSLMLALKDKNTAALRKGDLETAAELFRDALDVTLAVDNGVGTSSCRLHLAGLANRTGRHDQAEDLLAVNLPFVRAKGQIRCEGYTLASMANTTVQRG
jgi:hypothetical protein